jgi:LuxR family maltose regulon positive regulatory protein
MAVSEGRFDDAISIFRTQKMDADAAQDHRFSLRHRIDLAVALAASGKDNEAMQMLGELLQIASAAGVRRSILDRGPAMGNLLRRYRNNAGPLLPYVESLIAALGRPGGNLPVPTRIAGLANALSTREREILGLIGRGQSNKEIARSLGIGPETVKSHVKNIFTKLSVEKRVQAVLRAQNLGLVGTV